MELHTQRRERYALIRVIGQFWERGDIRALGDEIATLRSTGVPRIVLDLERLTFVNSIGLGAIVKMFADCAAAGHELMLLRPAGSVRETMEISDLPRFIKIVQSEEEILGTGREEAH